MVFDSRLTTYAHLARLDALGITFITLRRRSPSLLAEIEDLAPSAWRRVKLEVPARKYKTPRVFEQPVALAGASLRQLFILDLGHEEPTILLTNDASATVKQLIISFAAGISFSKRKCISEVAGRPVTQAPQAAVTSRAWATGRPHRLIFRFETAKQQFTAAETAKPKQQADGGRGRGTR